MRASRSQRERATAGKSRTARRRAARHRVRAAAGARACLCRGRGRRRAYGGDAAARAPAPMVRGVGGGWRRALFSAGVSDSLSSACSGPSEAQAKGSEGPAPSTAPLRAARGRRRRQLSAAAPGRGAAGGARCPTAPEARGGRAHGPAAGGHTRRPCWCSRAPRGFQLRKVPLAARRRRKRPGGLTPPCATSAQRPRGAPRSAGRLPWSRTGRRWRMQRLRAIAARAGAWKGLE